MVFGHRAKSIRPQTSFTGGGAPDIAVGVGSSGVAQASGSVKFNLDDGLTMEITDEDVGAARIPRRARRPEAPTKAMIQAHKLHHAEYREWCKHCVAGKGVCHQHKVRDEVGIDAEFSVF